MRFEMLKHFRYSVIPVRTLTKIYTVKHTKSSFMVSSVVSNDGDTIKKTIAIKIVFFF